MFKTIIKLLQRFYPQQLEQLLTPGMGTVERLFKEKATKDFVVYQKLVKVKKGKRKYYLAFIQSPKGKMRIWLSRHWDWDNINVEI